MKKLFISADIEGTCGIASWNETEKGQQDYPPFARQMSREVGAACNGALEAGMELVLVRDAHDSARNLLWDYLPQGIQMIRGWAQEPLSMMTGLDDSFHGVVLTGYHDAAGTGSNPLSHTMSGGITWITINGETASEGMLNAYTAAYFQVPVLAVTGDAGICAKMKALIPNVLTVPVNKGTGNAVLHVHPDVAVERIREAVKQACQMPREDCLLSLPPSIRLDVRYREHSKAMRSGFYPGVQRMDSHTLRYESQDWMEVLRMMHFCL